MLAASSALIFEGHPQSTELAQDSIGEPGEVSLLSADLVQESENGRF